MTEQSIVEKPRNSRQFTENPDTAGRKPGRACAPVLAICAICLLPPPSLRGQSAQPDDPASPSSPGTPAEPGRPSDPSEADKPGAPRAPSAPSRPSGPGPAAATNADLTTQALEFLSLPYDRRWYSNAVFYEVMVRSFQDSDGDGIGDLKGLTSRLDYLNDGDPDSDTDLEVDGIWLMPIFEAPSYHGYDAVDYYKVDPVYGKMSDLEDLFEEAHKRGIRVILDLVLNHTSTAHPWFQKSAKGPDASMRDWYVWSPEPRDWHQPWSPNPTWHQRGDWYYYGLFWEGMPDLNFAHPPVADEMIRIGRYWLERGADGYRLDAIRYLFEQGKDLQADLPITHAYLKRFARSMRGVNPEALLIGEIWSDTSDVGPYFGDGDELDLAFGFDESGAIKASIAAEKPGSLMSALERVASTYRERRFSAPFLSNHDMSRLASDFDRDAGALELAASLLLSLPGTPFLYQGEEIGLSNGPRAGDEGKRTPMQWDKSRNAGFTTAQYPWNPLSGNQKKVSVEAQQGRNGSLLSHYQALLRARRGSNAMRHGSIHAVTSSTGNMEGLMTFQRATKGELVVCLFNLKANGKRAFGPIRLDQAALEAAGLKTGRLSPVVLFGDGEAKLHDDILETPAIPPRGTLWVRVTST